MIWVLVIPLAIFRGFFIAIKYLLSNRVLLVLIVAGVVIGIVISQVNKNTKSPVQVEMPTYQLIAPTVQQAPRVVQTTSRVYYVSTMKDNGEVIILTHYYFYDAKKWQESDNPLPLDRQILGEIRIYNRA